MYYEGLSFILVLTVEEIAGACIASHIIFLQSSKMNRRLLCLGKKIEILKRERCCL